jgi:hypothetical protein
MGVLSHSCAMKLRMNGAPAQFEEIPQGLKPGCFSIIFGTTEVVPCYKTIQTEPVPGSAVPP